MGEMDDAELASMMDDDEASAQDDGEGSQIDKESSMDGDSEEMEGEFDMDAKVGHLSRADLANLTPEQMLVKWHEMLWPVEADLITELGATNTFFINAESIIFDLVNSREVPFEEDMQFLRMTHAIEQLMTSIASCGGKFRLVFFDNLQVLFSAAFGESVWAFRQAFLTHCKVSGIDHAVFSNWYSAEWKQHVATWRPSFFLLANDAVELEDEEDADDDEEEDIKPKLRGVFQAMMLRCLSFRTHVALLRGLQRRGNRIMAFTLEPDTHDSYIDHSVQGSLQPILEAEDEEEKGTESITTELKEFMQRAKDKMPADAVLRSFLISRFVKQTLAATKGQNKQTCQLMELVAKVLVLQEMAIRYIPLDKRAYSTCTVEDWSLYAESITGALDRFYTLMSAELGQLAKDGMPEGLEVDACDMFDGRLYRHTFHYVVSKGLSSDKKEVGPENFQWSDYVTSDLDFIWSEAAPKQSFFPIPFSHLKDLDGLEPPALPPKMAPRAKPELYDVQSDFLKTVWKDYDFDVTLCAPDEEDEEQTSLLVEKHQWKTGVYLDAVKQEQEMEKNEGEKRMEEKMKAKGKITDRDRAFMAKFALKQRQMALRALHQYAKSLTGSDKLHPPIIITEEKEGKKGKDDKDDKGKDDKKAEEKLSKKHQELLEKRKAEEEAKTQEHDAKQMKEWEKPVDALAEVGEPAKLEQNLLDMLIGFTRIVPSFVGFPALGNAFKTNEAKAKILVKVMKSIRTSLKKMQLDRQPTEKQPEVRSLIVYIFCIIQEGFNSFAKVLDGKGIKLFQEVLISIGFPRTAAAMFENWAEMQAPKAEEEDKEVEKEKGGKDDKKKGKDKDSKKDDKKKDKEKEKDKDKKDKKDKKDGDGDLSSYKVTKDVETFWSGVGPDEYAFQLMYMGPQMTRSVGNAKDPLGRVNFKPDKWQKDLLDIVDKKESSLIVAPTASGKTFIGYYVMDQVLRADHDGVAVYVAPSKALVNQVSAEIYARFSSKTYPAHSKHELLGVFLKEYNSAGGVREIGKWKNCQILVTIPHILEMLLLSPSNQDWVSRLRYVVFDEVHCIGEQEGGVQWEHCMQMIPCPFLALSATVADPSFFHNWLSRINTKKKVSTVEIVEHKERWNDLYKHIWHKNELRPLHPFCCLVENTLRRQGLSSDLSMVPREMAQLHQTLQKIIGKNDDWDKLSPSKFFSGRAFVTKKDAREWERELKATFLNFLSQNVLSSDGFSKLTLELQQEPQLDFSGNAKFNPPARTAAVVEAAAATEDGEADEAATDMTKIAKGASYLQPATLFKLCKDLDKRDIMPAIFFNFSRKEIERMLLKLIKELEDQQHNKYMGTEEAQYKTKKINERRQADYEQKKTAYEQALKMKASSTQEAKASRKSGENEGRGGGKAEAVDVSQDAQMPEPVKPDNIEDEIDPEFTFHSPKALGQWQEDIDELLSELKRKGTANWQIEGLRRGVGMHHEALRKNYKDAVEILFRRGYLRVVFATGTLALGINMPCRSTIFCGDSLELNGLMFRQMSGRAGRRGFDLLGQVIFLDMAFGKVQRLIASDLSSLAGEFTLSPTTLLRALQMWEIVSQDAELEKELPRSKADIARCLAPTFGIPFFQSKSAELATQVAYFTRFSLEILYKQGFINLAGATNNLANLATHLFEMEPANFALARLLSSGLLHQYLDREKQNERKGERRTHLTIKLLSVLAWMMYRRRLPSILPKEKENRKKHLPSEGCPKLPALPKKLKKEIMKYNVELFEIFQDFAWAVASTKKIGEADMALPFSQRSFRVGWDARGEPFDKKSEFAPCFIKQLVRYRSRSPFSALAGVGDTFSSSIDLCKYVRNVMHLDLNAIPTVSCPPEAGIQEDGELEPTNSWILDFMIHGRIQCLWDDNGINATAAWKMISEFKDSLKKTSTILKVYCPSDDIVLQTFDTLSDEMDRYLKGEGGK